MAMLPVNNRTTRTLNELATKLLVNDSFLAIRSISGFNNRLSYALMVLYEWYQHDIKDIQSASLPPSAFLSFAGGQRCQHRCLSKKIIL